MVYKNGTDQKVEILKRKHGLFGDVYIWNGHYIESLASHKSLIQNSIATTIEEALAERDQWETEQAELRRLEAEQYRLEHPENYDGMGE